MVDDAADIGWGRFAPSPSGDLHLGNLRTAVLAWLYARGSGRRIGLRVEDLDERTSQAMAERQLADLASIGLTWDGPILRQSDRRAVYTAVVEQLAERGLVYQCFCSRRDILQAPRAAHAPLGAYPGTCRDLSAAERAAAGRHRTPALRLRASRDRLTIQDAIVGPFDGVVDDFVLMRADGTAAYNLAVVVDDAATGVTQVVRGDDLLASTPRQAHLIDLLGQPRPQWAHVPLVFNRQGQRLAKRDGAMTLRHLVAAGVSPMAVLGVIAQSLGLARPGQPVTLADLADRWDPAGWLVQPWRVDDDLALDADVA